MTEVAPVTGLVVAVPDDYAREARRRNMSVRMPVEFVDEPKVP